MAHRNLVVHGEAAQALEMCRRLLRTESSDQRLETAQLVVERLRSGGTDDSADDVNALLRLLSNYVEPTLELTEEILSLLLFYEHRVLLIHNLPKLTFQSKDCVQLVLQAYLGLLATDRSLLVPVLGSLAEMPLDYSEKTTVVDATQSLLDAAVEEDIPAVVQSLLSMITKSSALKALARLRSECNRIHSGTLSLTMEVIGRHATAGSVALTALLRLIRHADPLTVFDVVFLTFVMGKSAENELAVKSTILVTQSGRLHSRTMRQATTMLVNPEWATLLPSFIRFCSCLLAVCFHASTRSTLALSLIAIAVHSLIALIESRSTVQNEALILLLTIASQPMKLLLFGSADSVQHSRGVLCWNVAEVIALGFHDLARRNASVLASSSHLFLDHLHGVVSTAIEVEASGKYPSHILDLLCSTVALLTKKERGIYSLLMITIQKQLVSRIPGMTNDQLASRFQSGRTRSIASETKQLMAVFLTGHLLKNQVVVESRDRNLLATWMLRLLTCANRDETLLYVLRFVREELKGATNASSLEKDRALLTSAISQVFRKKGLIWRPRGQLIRRPKDDSDYVIAYEGKATNLIDQDERSTLVLDVIEFVRKMRFGVPSPAFGAMDSRERYTLKRLTEQEYLVKICLLRELFYCYLDFASPAEKTEIAGAALVLPTSFTYALKDQLSESVEPTAMNDVIWNLVCGLDIAVASTNFAADLYNSIIAKSTRNSECTGQYSRMVTKLLVCLEQRIQLEQILGAHRRNILRRLDRFDDSRHVDTQKHELEWLLLESSITEQLLNGQLRRVQGELPRASLFGLDFRVICFFVEGLFKKSLDLSLSLAFELDLLLIFSRHLQSDDVTCSGFGECNVLSSVTRNQRFLVTRSEGRQTVLWLCDRAIKLSRAFGNDEFDQVESDIDEDYEVGTTELAVRDVEQRKVVASCLACIIEIFIVILEKCRLATEVGDSGWALRMMELLAAGSCPNDDLSYLENSHGSNEIFFRFLARQSLELTNPTLACLVLDALASLVLNTRKQYLVGQLCLSLLHQTFPTHSTPDQIDIGTGNLYHGLPLRTLSNAVVQPSNGHMCALAKYRCSSMKWSHIPYLLVGSWAYSTSASIGSALLAQYLGEMRLLIDAAVPQRYHKTFKTHVARFDDNDVESDGDNEDNRSQPEPSVVDGEHLVLKSLTNESLPYFIEAVLLCAIASLYRAGPKKPNTNGCADAEYNPFSDYCQAMHVFETTLRVFAQAEACGFNLPVKTNLLVIRGATFVTRSVKLIITKCVAWRIEQSVADNTGALKHLGVLFGAADAIAAAMEMVSSTFQERVVLKMQYDRSSRRKGGRSNDLLEKAYGKKYNTRRSISKNEARLLPILSHGIREFQDFLHDQSTVNNIVLETAKNEWKDAESVRRNFEYRNVMLSDDKLISACRTLQTNELTTTLLKDWRIALSNDNDNDETDLEEDEESIYYEEDSLSEEEDGTFAVKSGTLKQNDALFNTSVMSRSVAELHDNEELGFPAIVVNFKNRKGLAKPSH
ncbi:hypothetical protein Plhal304r1_c026g0086581 [Plasmopara halstedii]